MITTQKARQILLKELDYRKTLAEEEMLNNGDLIAAGAHRDMAKGMIIYAHRMNVIDFPIRDKLWMWVISLIDPYKMKVKPWG